MSIKTKNEIKQILYAYEKYIIRCIKVYGSPEEGKINTFVNEIYNLIKRDIKNEHQY